MVGSALKVYEKKISTDTIGVFGELHLLSLEISIEERTENGREHRALRNAHHLTIIVFTDLHNVLCDMLLQECKNILLL